MLKGLQKMHVHHRTTLAAVSHIESISATICAPHPSPSDIAEANLLEAWLPCLSDRGFPALWGMLVDHPRLRCRPILTPRLLRIDRADGWARSFQGLIRLGLSFAQRCARPTPTLHGLRRQVRMIETANYVVIECPRILDGLLADQARTVRMTHQH